MSSQDEVINVRYTCGSYVASCLGKRASSTASEKSAALAVVAKLREDGSNVILMPGVYMAHHKEDHAASSAREAFNHCRDMVRDLNPEAILLVVKTARSE